MTWSPANIKSVRIVQIAGTSCSAVTAARLPDRKRAATGPSVCLLSPSLDRDCGRHSSVGHSAGGGWGRPCRTAAAGLVNSFWQRRPCNTASQAGGHLRSWRLCLQLVLIVSRQPYSIRPLRVVVIQALRLPPMWSSTGIGLWSDTISASHGGPAATDQGPWPQSTSVCGRHTKLRFLCSGLYPSTPGQWDDEGSKTSWRTDHWQLTIHHLKLNSIQRLESLAVVDMLSQPINVTVKLNPQSCQACVWVVSFVRLQSMTGNSAKLSGYCPDIVRPKLVKF